MEIKTLAVQEVDAGDEGISQAEIEAAKRNNGIVSCVTYAYPDIPDDMLSIIYANDPAWVMEKRPDYVKRFHPTDIQ